jgi:hypothetical protein
MGSDRFLPVQTDCRSIRQESAHGCGLPARLQRGIVRARLPLRVCQERAVVPVCAFHLLLLFIIHDILHTVLIISACAGADACILAAVGGCGELAGPVICDSVCASSSWRRAGVCTMICRA